MELFKYIYFLVSLVTIILALCAPTAAGNLCAHHKHHHPNWPFDYNNHKQIQQYTPPTHHNPINNFFESLNTKPIINYSLDKLNEKTNHIIHITQNMLQNIGITKPSEPKWMWTTKKPITTPNFVNVNINCCILWQNKYNTIGFARRKCNCKCKKCSFTTRKPTTTRKPARTTPRNIYIWSFTTRKPYTTTGKPFTTTRKLFTTTRKAPTAPKPPSTTLKPTATTNNGTKLCTICQAISNGHHYFYNITNHHHHYHIHHHHYNGEQQTTTERANKDVKDSATSKPDIDLRNSFNNDPSQTVFNGLQNTEKGNKTLIDGGVTSKPDLGLDKGNSFEWTNNVKLN